MAMMRAGCQRDLWTGLCNTAGVGHHNTGGLFGPMASMSCTGGREPEETV